MSTFTRSKLFIPDPPPSKYQLFHRAKEQLLKEGSLILEDVPEDVALPLIEGLESDPQCGSERRFRFNYEKNKLTAFMPVRIHETAQIALGEILVYMKQTNFISYDQLHLLAGVVSGATYTGFVGPYAGTVKEPDALVRVRRRPQLWPIWVAEVGWSESRPSLDRDIDIWLRGTDYMVLLTILLKYDLRMSSTIAGYIIFYTQNGTRINRREIFPAPPNPIDDQITFTREELFGDSLTLEPGQAPGDTYTIDVSVFRSFATEYAELMGLTPVT